MRRKARTLPEGAAEQRCPMYLLANRGQALPDPLLLPQSTGAAHRLPPDEAHTPGFCSGMGRGSV